MSDAINVWRHTKMIVLVALTAALYAALLVPFKPIPIIPGITELRPANVVPIVASLLFGPAAAWGAAIGNLVGDFFGTLGPGSFFGFIGNLILGYLPYRLWRTWTRGKEPTGAASQVPVFLAVCIVASAACGVVIAWGVDLLGLVPFKILATVITLNNTLAGFVLGIILLPLLYPRAKRWRLLCGQIMADEELAESRWGWATGNLAAVLSVGGAGWAALLWARPELLPEWAGVEAVRPAATLLSAAILAASWLVAWRPAIQTRSEEPTSATVEAIENAAAVEVCNFTFTYSGGKRPALSRVTLEQEPGQFRVLMGATGAGKTTLCGALAGVVPWLAGGECEGAVRLFGAEATGRPPRALAGLVGLLLQDFETQLLGTTVEGAVAFPLENLGVEPEQIGHRVRCALEAVGIEHLAARAPETLSGGEKQRAALAAVLAMAPRILVMDEPTTDLDPEGRAQAKAAWQSLRAEDYTLIVSEQDPELALEADVLTVLRAGEVAYDGPPHDLLRNPAACRQSGIRAPEVAEIAAAAGLSPTCDEAELIRQLKAAGARLGAELPPAAEAWPAPGRELARAEELAAGYGAGEVVKDVSLAVHEGELVAILGRNGSGKTTLAKCLDGLLAPYGGRVTLGGDEPQYLRRDEVARRAGLLFQNPDHQLIAATVREEVRMGPHLAGLAAEETRRNVEWALDVTGLTDLADEDPFALPKGLRQKVALASVLAFRPPLIIFDEPTTGL
ncbi:MAG: ATP-binding cassette domain-containing protein, partial [Armatimonadetes bacterium]|nr:ATP-binding cassette domain-containing protein [Armatimonadota bacterium]